MVTDVIASRECDERVFVAAADSDSAAFGFLWTLPASAQGMTGTTFSLKGGQWLFVAAKPAKPGQKAVGCFVTWSAFRPRLVPSLASEGEDYTLGPL